jgi:pyridoxal phosphate enzyme (YggS family)
MSLFDNFRAIRERIDAIALSAGRNPGEVSIIAVTKTHPPAAIQEAIDAGIRIFGENRVQEAKTKIPSLSGEFSFHLVGHLQSNKARDAVELFSVIESIDKQSTAEKVDREAEKIRKVQKILVQVNTSGEETKSGAEPSHALELCRGILALKNLELTGLMTIGPLTDDEQRIRESFRMLRNLLKDINARLGLDLRELSMGMSSDYPIAVEEGATMVRIGTAIFGTRSLTNEPSV